MIKLEKYHKQFWKKSDLKKLEQINKDFKLSLNTKKARDLLYLQVFETSLSNKETFEKSFDEFRRIHIDMWENMTFNERNFFIHKDMRELKSSLKSFTYEDGQIYIVFFNKLMNVLYDQETAILELPQFLKLYNKFDDEIIDMSTYGIEPYKANMAWPKCLAFDKNNLVLFDDNINMFFHFEGLKNIEILPIYEKSKISSHEAKEIADLILSRDEAAFFRYLYVNDLMSPRLSKRYKKILKRSAK